MKKAIVLFSAIAALSLSQASELWWTVNNPVDVSGEGGGENLTWATAKLYASANGYNYNGNLVDTVTADNMSDLGFWNSTITSYANSQYSFYVELCNSNGDPLGRSAINVNPSAKQGAVSYTDLVTAGAVYDGNLMNPTASAYTGFSSFTTSNVVPEPTSGLLVLFGMMALGLKRKRV